jgi:hypothetical protein
VVPPGSLGNGQLKGKEVSMKKARGQERNLHTCVHHSTIHSTKLWNEARCPSTDEWMEKTWYIYTMECYSTIKKN